MPEYIAEVPFRAFSRLRSVQVAEHVQSGMGSDPPFKTVIDRTHLGQTLHKAPHRSSLYTSP